VYSINVFIVHRFGDITTFIDYVTACDIKQVLQFEEDS